MKAIGIVLSTNGRFATVASQRSSACSACRNCDSRGACHAELVFGEQTQSVEISALNVLGADIGDKVELESSTSTMLISSVLVFVLPIVISMICFIFTDMFTDNNIVPYLILITAFITSFISISKTLNIFYKNNHTAKIVKIVEESD